MIKSCRPYIVPTVVLLLLSILGGKLLLTPVQEPPIRSLFQITYESVRGWPWPYSRSFKTLDATSKIPQQRQATEFFYGWLLADLAVLLTMLAIAALLLRWRYRRRGRWLRFSVGDLLTVITLVALACGWTSRQHQQWLREQRFITGDATDQFDAEIQYQGPEWLRRLWPSDQLTIFNRVVRLTVNDSHPPDESAASLTAAMPDFRYLHRIVLHASVAARLVEPAPFSTIEDVYLFPDANTEVVDGALLAISHWPHMRELTIHVTHQPLSFSDQALAALGNSATLETLNVPEGQLPNVTDAGITALAKAPRLNSLILPETQITDAAMKSVAQMPALKYLCLMNMPKLTDEGLRSLAESKTLHGASIAGSRHLSNDALQLLAGKLESLNVGQPDGAWRPIQAAP